MLRVSIGPRQRACRYRLIESGFDLCIDIVKHGRIRCVALGNCCGRKVAVVPMRRDPGDTRQLRERVQVAWRYCRSLLRDFVHDRDLADLCFGCGFRLLLGGFAAAAAPIVPLARSTETLSRTATPLASALVNVAVSVTPSQVKVR